MPESAVGLGTMFGRLSSPGSSHQDDRGPRSRDRRSVARDDSSSSPWSAQQPTLARPLSPTIHAFVPALITFPEGSRSKHQGATAWVARSLELSKLGDTSADGPGQKNASWLSSPNATKIHPSPDRSRRSFGSKATSQSPRSRDGCRGRRGMRQRSPGTPHLERPGRRAPLPQRMPSRCSRAPATGSIGQRERPGNRSSASRGRRNRSSAGDGYERRNAYGEEAPRRP
jgi:hypothetical protein